MNYEDTVELEANIKIKDEADKICLDFENNIKLKIKDYKGDGKFKLWSDPNNSIYVVAKKDYFEFQCRFLHEAYDVDVTPESVFNGIKSGYRGIDHLRTHSKG